MNRILACKIQPSLLNYEIEIQRGILKDGVRVGRFLSSLGSKVVIITNETLAPLYGHSLYHVLNNQNFETHLITFKDGEKYKSRRIKEQVEDELFQKKCGKDTCLIALGGGVVMDMVGFIAATYCRGVPLVMMPTSLLGMVDSCLGGKTGLNLSHGKNLIGVIYQPKKVYIDPSTLNTLPLKELRNGAAEIIKHGLIADLNLFEYLEKHLDDFLGLKEKVVEKVIYASCFIKKEVVEQDEHEKGRRRFLNFGHTIGHALEKLSDYQLAHGEAVAMGLIAESYLSFLLGYLDHPSLQRICNLIKKVGFAFKIPSYSFEEIQAAMQLDKKSQQGKPRFVLLSQIGRALEFEGNCCSFVESEIVKKALSWMYNDLRDHSGSYL